MVDFISFFLLARIAELLSAAVDCEHIDELAEIVGCVDRLLEVFDLLKHFSLPNL